MKDRTIVLSSLNSEYKYNDTPPYHPSTSYPEYCFNVIDKGRNHIYHEVRTLLYQLGFDKQNFNKPTWNPFGYFIEPVNNVLLKPNMVNHIHPLGFTHDCLITHGSFIRCLVDYVTIALKGKGRITIGDAPIQFADFDEIAKKWGV